MLTLRSWLTRPSRLALVLGAVFGFTLFSAQDLRAEITAYVVDIQQISGRRITRDLTDFTYTIRVVNQGGAILNASAFVRSLSPNTVIQDNEVILGAVPTGSTITSTDTFTLRQYRLVPFRLQDLVWTIQGQEANTRPLANAGPDQTVPTGTTVTLDGSGSTDADGQPLTYRWSLVSKPAGSAAALSSSSVPMPSVTIDRGGDYLFDLIVNDGQVDSLTDRVRVSTINSAPVANAGPDRTVPRNSNVQLDGSLSSDPDFDALSYEWAVVLRPTGSTAELVNPTTVMPSLLLDRPGDYRVRLVVRDAQYASSPDFINFSTENSIPVANPGPDVEAARSTPTILDGSASSDADNDPISFSWSLLNKPANSNSTIAQPGLPQTTITPDQFGIYVVQLIVNDGWANSAAVTKTISVLQPANRPPNAVADSATTVANTAVTVDVLANDSDPDADPISLIAFSQPTTGGTVTQVAGGLRFTPTAGFTGTAFFGYTITDGQVNASAAVTVTVNGAQNQSPVLNAIANRTINVGATLSLQLIGTDPDVGDSLTYSMPSTPSGANFSSPRVTWTPNNSQLGLNNFSARVQDSAGAADTETFTVTVVAGNRPPAFGPLLDDTTSTLANYAKAVTVSDSDGDAVIITLVDGPAGLTLAGSTVSWRPGASQIGRFIVKLRASDPSGAFTAAQFQITVTGATPPLARDDAYTVKVGETLTVNAPGVLANDVSGSGNPLSAVNRSDPTLGTLDAFSADGSFSYTAPAIDPKPPFAIVASKIGNGAIYRQPFGLAPALADLNQDGKPDLVYFGYSGPTLVATAISAANNQALWSDIGGLDANACENNLGNYPGYALGDIEDDGQIELVTVTGCRNGESGYQRIAAFGSDGSRKWVSDLLTKEFFDVRCAIGGCAPGAVPTRTDYSLLFESSLSVTRLAANEAPVIMTRAEIPATAGQVYTELSPGVLGYKEYGCRIVTGDAADMGQACMVTLLISGTDGSVLQVLRSPLRPQFNRGIPISPFRNNPPFAADLDGDGAVEIISGADVWKRVGNTWTLAWQGAAEPEQVAVADLDGDGRQEVIWALDRVQNLAADTPYLGFVGFLIFDANGQELRRIPLPNRFPGMMTIADVDGDRTPEILMTEAGILHAVGADGSFLWSYLVPDNPVYPQPPGFRTSYRNSVVVYDLDGDGNTEVIFNSSSGLHILEGRTGIQKAYFNAGPRYANISASNTTFVSDWDNDGHADIVSFGEVGGSANEAFAYVIKSANNDWLPAAKIHNQVMFQPSSINETGRILFDPSVSRSYRNPKQLGAVRDPRETAGTVFQYAASDGLTESANAKVFLAISAANSPPVFTSRPPSSIQSEGVTSPVIYQATAVDPDAGDSVTYSLNAVASNGVTGPSIYMDVNPATGVVSTLQSTSFGNFTWRVTLTATDSQGASATQTFVLRHETRARVSVPNVVGSAMLAATQTLTAADLQSTVLQEQFSALPAGQVIAQNPVAASNQPRGTTVLLTVSKGPAPTVVPNVVGRSQSAANTALTAAGFAPAVTRVFSNSVDAGIVILQAVPPGVEQAGGSVGLVVSAGSGLDLTLARSVTPANEPVPFTLVARDLNGAVIALPPVTMTIAPDSATSGALPTVGGNSIAAANNTRGRYRLTVTDGARVTTAIFVVLQPNTPAKPAMIAKFAQLDAVLGSMDSLLAEADAARLASDTGLMTTKMNAWVNTWRTVNINKLSLATPVAPEGGFPMDVSEIAALGVTQSTDDVLNKTILTDAVDDLLDIEEALRDPSTPYQQIIGMFRAFNARADRIHSIAPGEYGALDAKGLYAELLAHRLPRAMDALVEDVAKAFGMPPRPARYPLIGRADVGPANDSRWARPLMASVGPSGIAGADTVYVNSTLAEELTTTVVQAIVDGIDTFSIRKFYESAFKTAGWSAAVMVAANHLKEFAGGVDHELRVTTGASFAVNIFDAPYSTIEGLGLNGRHPSLNKVYIVGPAVGQALAGVLEKVKALGDLPSQAAGVAKAKDLDEMQDGLDEMQDAMDELHEAGNNFQQALNRVYQDPHERSAVSDCLFVSGPLCRSIQYSNGFKTVYQSFGLDLAVPILFVVVNSETGFTLIGTPVFIPGGD